MIEITLTTIAAYGSFVAAEALHFSGVIATVAAGMLCGNYAARTGMAASTRVSAETFWEYVAFALNSIVFLLIGFRVRIGDLLHSWLPILAAYVAVTAGRGLVVIAVSGLLRPTRRRLPASWSVVLTWGGVRGALSMVLALALPTGLPHRDFLVTTTFGVVILSILVQGLTMSPLLRRLGIVRRDEAREQYERLRARVRAVNAALAELDSMARRRSAPHDVLQTLREEYQERMRRAEGDVRHLHVEQDRFRQDELLAARRHLLITEKDHVLAAARHGDLDEGTTNGLLTEIDGRLVELAAGGSEHPDRNTAAGTSQEQPAVPSRGAARKHRMPMVYKDASSHLGGPKMKRIIPIVLVATAVSITVWAQGGRRGAPPPSPLEPGASQADVDKALIAAPAALRNQATVIKWKSDFTYDTLRKGTNGLVCYDRSGFPLQQPFSVQCTSLANLAREAQNLKAEALGERSKSEAMLKSEEQDGTRVKPEFGSVWYHVSGPNPDHVSPHQVTIAVPGATGVSLGIPEKRRDNGVWLMNAGTSTAHIMIPGR